MFSGIIKAFSHESPSPTSQAVTTGHRSLITSELSLILLPLIVQGKSQAVFAMYNKDAAVVVPVMAAVGRTPSSESCIMYFLIACACYSSSGGPHASGQIWP